jgi:ABC-2 type transport system permease protein
VECPATLPFWRPTESISQRHLDGTVVAVLFILMLSAAMIRCVHVMYSRSDLDLLLCSPVPGSTILRARLAVWCWERCCWRCSWSPLSSM